MPSAKTSPNNTFWLAMALAAALAAILAVGLCGCASTILPPVASASATSWDGTNQNSGFLGYTTNAAGQVTGGIITAHARDRYNALMRDYGRAAWNIQRDDDGLVALTGDTWFIDAQHLAYFAEGNRWRKNGK